MNHPLKRAGIMLCFYKEMGGWRQGWLQEIRQISGKWNCRFISLRTCLDPCHEPLHKPHTFTWDAGKGRQSTHDRQSAVIITHQWVSCTFWMWIMSEILSKTTVQCLYHFFVYVHGCDFFLENPTSNWSYMVELNSGWNQSNRLICCPVQCTQGI